MTARAANDLDPFWMPFTANRSFKAQPRLLASAKDMHYFTPDGRPILDGTAGLWCVNAGHARKPIVEAIQRQAEVLDYAPTFQLGHPLVFELAARLGMLFPADIDHVFFAGSGSEGVDTALKIALAYQQAKGHPERTRLIGRQKGYHGVGFGGISVGGLENNRRGFPTLPGVDHLSHTLNLDEAAFSRGQPTWGGHLADELEVLIAEHGAETIAAVIVEPLSGSAGVIVPPVGYLERLREITRQHGILLIFDEVITGFGRVGGATASETLGVIPDLLVCAKGLTNGAVPMGAVGVRSEIYDAVVNQAAAPGIEFFHGYTYSGHPLAAAAGLATLDVYETEGLFQRASDMAPYWEDSVHGLKGLPNVIDIRNLGMVAAVELAPRPDAPGARATAVFHAAFDEGILVRVTGDVIALSPPLIISRAQIDKLIDHLSQIIRRTP
ncbi:MULTISPECIES: aspartate aminotransferase family protein [unclassified Brevundimonas]|uniref:aspartate aminotransferase family protein n=1 Tax=unclassified Brevundimonas TaxID=2622653 RepID=UPI000CFBA2FE|nr:MULTISPECIES: aspartate aminotransferase family protein [unclassified Brevundimonas]PRA26873.1 aspartate aminotransferase family protein [Brevundimonas sp. MYb27]PQZ76972.1 aspartate aminotransferase family protein [Brevundimonas sp. MYb31]PRB11834.1 aspartate aminotransferase family protein [Brevundimonas sp. MYb52]PRB32818.1 aspartate aminotransferase family protein [Brevundimonas sp. MYb46]PRB47261.1 aspartate aminotransferase family protein [Brevundimonas sp. MYb33]